MTYRVVQFLERDHLHQEVVSKAASWLRKTECFSKREVLKDVRLSDGSGGTGLRRARDVNWKHVVACLQRDLGCQLVAVVKTYFKGYATEAVAAKEDSDLKKFLAGNGKLADGWIAPTKQNAPLYRLALGNRVGIAHAFEAQALAFRKHCVQHGMLAPYEQSVIGAA